MRPAEEKQTARKSKSGAWRVVLALLLSLGGAWVAMLSLAVPIPPSGASTAAAPLALTSIPPAHFSATSPAIVTEFSDFECSYCKRAVSVIWHVSVTAILAVSATHILSATVNDLSYLSSYYRFVGTAAGQTDFVANL
jgi:hypothetical protein